MIVATEFEVRTDAEHTLLHRTGIVSVVEDIVHTEVDHRVIAELLLHHDVPDAIGLGLVDMLRIDDVRQPVHLRVVVVIVGKGVGVEHADVVVAPERAAPACFLVLVGYANVDLVCRAVEQLARHERIALVDRMEIGVAQLSAPTRPELLLDLCLKPCDFCAPDVLEAVDHIRRTHPFVRTFELRCEVHIAAGKVDGHIVADTVVENTDARIGVLCLALDTYVDVDGFLGLQIRVALPPPSHPCCSDTDGGTAIHLPVVPELAHAGFCIACADVRLEAGVGAAAQVVRQTDAAGDVRAEEVAVIDTQDGEEEGVL